MIYMQLDPIKICINKEKINNIFSYNSTIFIIILLGKAK